jgi:hypothetical protein
MTAEIHVVHRGINVGGQKTDQHQDETETGQLHERGNPNTYGSQDLQYAREKDDLDSVWNRGRQHLRHFFRSNEMTDGGKDKEE